ncbi:MAG: sensory box histidine kinase/response regulator, partial [Myxococcaceae bacterium]|nr:sensory box histidine kinase/response regulator [Myxococcaceae bacterium]
MTVRHDLGGGHFQKQQAVLRAVLESPSGIVIFALDREYRYLAFNENHARTIKAIWGEEVRVGRNMLELIKRDDDREKARENFDRALLGESFTLHEEYGDVALERRYYEVVYSPIADEEAHVIGLTVYLTDITDRRRAELELEVYRNGLEEMVKQRTAELESAHAQLLHVQKLESLGVLAGGIAHDFNNLLAVILGRAELAAALVTDDARAHLAIVQETALEARMLTKQLLGYSGKGKFMVQVVDLNQLLESMMQLLRATVSRAITLSFELPAESQIVEADLTQVRQVVLNLVTNAAEAIGERVGTVTIRTRSIELDHAFLLKHRAQPLVPEGRYVAIEVEDTGSGMDERVRSKLFDPFFTTKFAGRGLGLAAVLGIVTSHRGTIAVNSRPGTGTLFSVLLPAARNGAQPAGEEAKRNSSKPPTERATILVVDDEKAVRATMRAALESLGHEVMMAASGREACDLFRQHKDVIQLIVLDLTMPEMNGEQTLRALQLIDQDVRVLVTTGYAEEDVRERFKSGELAGFLAKPFVRGELCRAVA